MVSTTRHSGGSTKHTTAACPPARHKSSLVRCHPDISLRPLSFVFPLPPSSLYPCGFRVACHTSYVTCLLRTLPLSSAPYGGLSRAPCSAPSLSPPLSNCRICCDVFWTSAVEMGVTAGVRELRSKLAGLSGSRASMLMVRQLMLAMAEAVRRKQPKKKEVIRASNGGRHTGWRARRRSWDWSCGEVASRIVGCSRGSTLAKHWLAASILSKASTRKTNCCVTHTHTQKSSPGFCQANHYKPGSYI